MKRSGARSHAGWSQDVLKSIAMGTMLLNHIATIFLPAGTVLCELFTAAGYFTAISMVYFLVEGYGYTRSKRNYFFRLLLFAGISQLPYDLAFSETGVLRFCGLNMLFTLCICFGILWVLEHGNNRCGSGTDPAEQHQRLGMAGAGIHPAVSLGGKEPHQGSRCVCCGSAAVWRNECAWRMGTVPPGREPAVCAFEHGGNRHIRPRHPAVLQRDTWNTVPDMFEMVFLSLLSHPSACFGDSSNLPAIRTCLHRRIQVQVLNSIRNPHPRR